MRMPRIERQLDEAPAQPRLVELGARRSEEGVDAVDDAEPVVFDKKPTFNRLKNFLEDHALKEAVGKKQKDKPSKRGDAGSGGGGGGMSKALRTATTRGRLLGVAGWTRRLTSERSPPAPVDSLRASAEMASSSASSFSTRVSRCFTDDSARTLLAACSNAAVPVRASAIS